MVETFNNAVAAINDFLWSYLLLILLMGVGLYFSYKLKLVQFRLFGEMMRLITKGFDRKKK